MEHYTFKTKIGYIGLTFTKKYLLEIKLPMKNKKELCSYLNSKANSCEVLPSFIKKTESVIKKYLSGIYVDFSNLPLQFSCTSFQSTVYNKCREIPFGVVVTYKDLAISSGSPKAARAIGMCMKNNKFPIVIPCHRVIGSSGKLIGFNAYSGLKLKKQLLELEKN